MIIFCYWFLLVRLIISFYVFLYITFLQCGCCFFTYVNYITNINLFLDGHVGNMRAVSDLPLTVRYWSYFLMPALTQCVKGEREREREKCFI